MNGVTRISSEQDVMMITFTEADTASALADALTAFAQKGVVVDMICQSAPRAATIDFSFTMPASYFESAMQTISEYRTGAGSAPLISSGYSKINLFGEEMVTSCGDKINELEAFRQEAFQFAVDNGYDHPDYTDWVYSGVNTTKQGAVSATAATAGDNE